MEVGGVDVGEAVGMDVVGLAEATIEGALDGVSDISMDGEKDGALVSGASTTLTLMNCPKKQCDGAWEVKKMVLLISLVTNV